MLWDNSAMESFFSSLKTERTARKTYRTAAFSDFGVENLEDIIRERRHLKK